MSSVLFRAQTSDKVYQYALKLKNIAPDSAGFHTETLSYKENQQHREFNF